MHVYSNLYYKNGVRLPDGSIPTVGDISKNSSLSIQGKGISELSDEADKATSDFYTSDWDLLMSKDLYEAHDVRAVHFLFISWSNSLFYYIHRKQSRRAMMTGPSGAGCTTRWV